MMHFRIHPFTLGSVGYGLALGMALTMFAGFGGPGAGAEAASASTAAARPITRAMEFNFENAPIETVLDEMSARLGFIIEATVPLTGKVSVIAPEPINADEAVSLLNSLLVPLGYAAIEAPPRQTMDGTMSRVLRVMPWEEAKKEAPVAE